MIPFIRSPISCEPHTRRLTHAKQERLRAAFTADEAHISVEVAYRCVQHVRDVFHQNTPAQGRRLATHLVESLPMCPIPNIARLGRTLRKWKDAFLAYCDTGGASNGPTEAINGIIELGRRIARGYRNPTNYQLRMLDDHARQHPALKSPQTVCSCWSRWVSRISKRSLEPCVVDSHRESVCSPPALPSAP